jgi:hypothetical protein
MLWRPDSQARLYRPGYKPGSAPHRVLVSALQAHAPMNCQSYRRCRKSSARWRHAPGSHAARSGVCQARQLQVSGFQLPPSRLYRWPGAMCLSSLHASYVLPMPRLQVPGQGAGCRWHTSFVFVRCLQAPGSRPQAVQARPGQARCSRPGGSRVSGSILYAPGRPGL